MNEATRLPVENPALRTLQEGAILGLANHTLLIARDGTEHPIDDSAAPIRGESGVALGAVLVFRDVAERKRSEEAERTPGGHRRIVRRCDRQQVTRRHHPFVEFWSRTPFRLYGSRSHRPVNNTHHPAGTAGRGTGNPWANRTR